MAAASRIRDAKSHYSPPTKDPRHPYKFADHRLLKPRLACQCGVFRHGGRAEPSVIRYSRKFSSV